jgi:hypothetical protein
MRWFGAPCFATVHHGVGAIAGTSDFAVFPVPIFLGGGSTPIFPNVYLRHPTTVIQWSYISASLVRYRPDLNPDDDLLDGTILAQAICRDALQIVASTLVDQRVQRERALGELQTHLRSLEDYRKRTRRRRHAAHSTGPHQRSAEPERDAIRRNDRRSSRQARGAAHRMSDVRPARPIPRRAPPRAARARRPPDRLAECAHRRLSAKRSSRSHASMRRGHAGFARSAVSCLIGRG